MVGSSLRRWAEGSVAQGSKEAPQERRARLIWDKLVLDDQRFWCDRWSLCGRSKKIREAELGDESARNIGLEKSNILVIWEIGQESTNLRQDHTCQL